MMNITRPKEGRLNYNTIFSDPPCTNRLIEAETRGEDEGVTEEENVMRMEEDEDPFTTKLITFQQDGVDLSPVVASRTLLKSLGPGEVDDALEGIL